MKKLLIIALVASTLSACQKKTCWTCVINTVLPRTTNTPNNTIIYSDVCDKTKSEIREYEKSNTYTRGTTSQSVSCSEK